MVKSGTATELTEWKACWFISLFFLFIVILCRSGNESFITFNRNRQMCAKIFISYCNILYIYETGPKLRIYQLKVVIWSALLKMLIHGELITRDKYAFKKNCMSVFFLFIFFSFDLDFFFNNIFFFKLLSLPRKIHRKY